MPDKKNEIDEWIELRRQEMRDEPLSPEEIKQIMADKKAREGTGVEYLKIEDDGALTLQITQWFPGGDRGCTDLSIPVGDEDYEYLCKRHKISKPGQWSCIDQRLDGKKWIEIGHRKSD